MYFLELFALHLISNYLSEIRGGDNKMKPGQLFVLRLSALLTALAGQGGPGAAPLPPV